MKLNICLVTLAALFSAAAIADNVRMDKAASIASNAHPCLMGDAKACSGGLVIAEGQNPLSVVSKADACLVENTANCDQTLLNPANAAAIDKAAETELTVCDNAEWCGEQYQTPNRNNPSPKPANSPKN